MDSGSKTLSAKLKSARNAFEAYFWDKSGLADKATDAKDPRLTKHRANELKAIIAEIPGDDYIAAVYNSTKMILEKGWVGGKALLDIENGFDVPPTWAIQELHDHADDFGNLVVAREQQALIDAIDASLVDGPTIKNLSDRIRDTFAEGYHVYDDDGNLVRRVPTDEWSEMVAQTELSRAQTQGAIALYKTAGLSTVTYVTNSGQTVCDECDALDGETFQLDDLDDENTPPMHPNCCCSLVPGDDEVAAMSDDSDEE